MQSPKRGPPLNTSTEFSIPGYERFYKNRMHKKGGVICYVKNKYPAVIIIKDDSEKYDTVYVEQETVYRPPKQQAADDAALYEEIHTITQNSQSSLGTLTVPTLTGPRCM